jgi:hypothetical protein
MLPVLLDACAEMDRIFWAEAYGDRDTFLGSIEDVDARRFAEFNHGPWDRQSGGSPFLANVGTKPPGARFYPADMSTDEYDAACAESPERARALTSEYTLSGVMRTAGSSPSGTTRPSQIRSGERPPRFARQLVSRTTLACEGISRFARRRS